MFHSFHVAREHAVLLAYHDKFWTTWQTDWCHGSCGASLFWRTTAVNHCKRHSWFVRCHHRCDVKDVHVLSETAQVAQGTTMICVAHAFLLAVCSNNYSQTANLARSKKLSVEYKSCSRLPETISDSKAELSESRLYDLQDYWDSLICLCRITVGMNWVLVQRADSEHTTLIEPWNANRIYTWILTLITHVLNTASLAEHACQLAW